MQLGYAEEINLLYNVKKLAFGKNILFGKNL